MNGSSSWDPKGEAQAALRTIVADPRYGAATLSNAPVMGGLLRSALPGAPREASVLVAAAEAGVPWNLQSSLAQGMELGSASRIAAGSLADRTALTPDACTWAVAALATALSMGGSAGTEAGVDTELDATRDDMPAFPAFPGAPAFPVAGLAGSQRRSAGAGSAGTGFGPVPGLRFAAPALAGIGALLIIWACALPDAYFPSGEGRQSYSIFNSGGGGALWYALEPTGVAVIAAAIAVVIVVAERSAIAGWLAPGMLIAFGIQTAFFFAGYEFSVQHPARTGAGELVGFLAALLLMTAGAVAAFRRATTAPVITSAPAPAQPLAPW